MQSKNKTKPNYYLVCKYSFGLKKNQSLGNRTKQRRTNDMHI